MWLDYYWTPKNCSINRFFYKKLTKLSKNWIIWRKAVSAIHTDILSFSNPNPSLSDTPCLVMTTIRWKPKSVSLAETMARFRTITKPLSTIVGHIEEEKLANVWYTVHVLMHPIFVSQQKSGICKTSNLVEKKMAVTTCQPGGGDREMHNIVSWLHFARPPWWKREITVYIPNRLFSNLHGVPSDTMGVCVNQIQRNEVNRLYEEEGKLFRKNGNILAPHRTAWSTLRGAFWKTRWMSCRHSFNSRGWCCTQRDNSSDCNIANRKLNRDHQRNLKCFLSEWRWIIGVTTERWETMNCLHTKPTHWIKTPGSSAVHGPTLGCNFWWKISL